MSENRSVTNAYALGTTVARDVTVGRLAPLTLLDQPSALVT